MLSLVDRHVKGKEKYGLCWSMGLGRYRLGPDAELRQRTIMAEDGEATEEYRVFTIVQHVSSGHIKRLPFSLEIEEAMVYSSGGQPRVSIERNSSSRHAVLKIYGCESGGASPRCDCSVPLGALFEPECGASFEEVQQEICQADDLSAAEVLIGAEDFDVKSYIAATRMRIVAMGSLPALSSSLSSPSKSAIVEITAQIKVSEDTSDVVDVVGQFKTPDKSQRSLGDDNCRG